MAQQPAYRRMWQSYDGQGPTQRQTWLCCAGEGQDVICPFELPRKQRALTSGEKEHSHVVGLDNLKTERQTTYVLLRESSTLHKHHVS